MSVPGGCPEEPQEVEIVNDCSNPIGAEVCNTDPIDVRIVNPTPDVEKVFYCNETTDTHWVRVCVYEFDADGNTVENLLSEFDTGVSCSDPVPDSVDVDVEYLCNAETGVYDRIVTTIVNGVITGSDVTPTTTSCDPDCEFVGTESWCDEYEYIIVDGVRWVASECAPGVVKWVHETDDAAIIYEDSIIAGWAYVVNSAIDPTNCSVEAAGVLPGSPPDPTTLEVFAESQPVIVILEECDGVVSKQTVVDDGSGVCIPYTVLGGLTKCAPEVVDTECRKWVTLAVGLDNTRTRYSWNSTIELTNSDGTTSTFTQTATGGWTAQIQQWATELQALYPDCVVEPRCNLPGGCGGLLGPVSDAPLPRMYARYVHISCCPTGVYPVSARISAGVGAGRSLILDFATTPEKRGYVCRTCDDGEGELKYSDGSVVPAADQPACTFACSEALPTTPESSTDILFGCDNGTVPETSVIAYVDTITGGVEYYTIDADGGLEEYTLIGEFLVDCETPIEDICEPTLLAVESKVDYVAGGDTQGQSAELVDYEILLFGAKYWTHPSITINGITSPISGAQANTAYGSDVLRAGGEIEQAIRASVNDECATSPLTFTATVENNDDWFTYHANSANPQPSIGTYNTGGENTETRRLLVENVPSNTVLDSVSVETWSGIHAQGISPLYDIVFVEVARRENTCAELESCTPIQVIKERDCDGVETFRYVVEDQSSGLLIPYTPLGRVLDKCPEVDCNACTPDVVTDTVCYDADQTVDGVLIPAGQPIIRKIVTYYEASGCDCVETTSEVLYFDFQNPSTEFVETPLFVGVCDSETQTVIRCDRNGQEIQVTSITVFTEDGGLLVVTYADVSGNPIPDPLLPLSVCNPDVEIVDACIIDPNTGERVYGSMHVPHDTIGNPGYDVASFTSNNGLLYDDLSGVEFFLNCTDTKTSCVEDFYEYCYDVSSFVFGCPTSTLEVGGETIDLCDGMSGDGLFVTAGDICATGGIRSENDGVRHPNATNLTGAGYDISLVTTDALGVATQVTNEGCIGGATQSGVQTVKTLFGADVFGLSGSAATITLGATWHTGSGIAVGVYDCASQTILPFAPGETQTPSVYDFNNFGVEVYNSPTGAWSYNGAASWMVDTSTVADLSTLVVYLVVLNPTGDELCDLTVNGNSPAPISCDINSVDDLVTVLSDVVTDPISVVGDTICIRSSNGPDHYGSMTCDTTIVDPTVTMISERVESQRVHLDDCSIADLSCNTVQVVCYCVQSKGSIKSVKEVESVKSLALAEKSISRRVKESQTVPGKILQVCEERAYDCSGDHVFSTYLYQGKQIDQATFDKLGLSVVACDSPDASYSAGAVTCATEDVLIDFVPVTVVLNCTVFTNENDPTDVFTQYTLADDYTTEGLGGIGDLYTPENELSVIPCPPGSIVETIECYEAVNSIKGVANAGETITVTSVTNNVAGTTHYTIVHTASNSTIYTGDDPIGDAGIDTSDPLAWAGPVPCDPIVEQGGVLSRHEVCIDTGGGVVDGWAVVETNQTTTNLLRLEDTVGNPITGSVVECECPCVDVTGCITVEGFDNDSTFITPGDFSQYTLVVDGVVQSTTIHDYTTTQTGSSKASWYDPIIAAINALPNWSITLLTDVVLPLSGKPVWTVTYNGPGSEELRIEKDFVGGTSPDVIILTAAADGSITGLTDSYSSGNQWLSSPFGVC